VNKPTDRRWWSRPANRVTALSLALGAAILAAQAGYLGAVGAPDLRHDLPHAVAVMVIFFVSEGFAIHLRVRRGGHAMSVSEIPVVLGILTVSPVVLLVARLVGGGLGLAVLRRQRGLKLAFNVSLIGLQATVTALIFVGLAGPPADLGPREWIAMYVAVFVSDALAAAMITVVIAMHDDPGELRRLTRAFHGLPLVAITATVALIGAMAIQNDIRALLLLGVAGIVVYGGYRAYVRQSQGHAQVEELYAFTRALDGSRDSAEVARIVLTQVRDQLRAEAAELIVPGPEGRGWLRTRLSGADEIGSTWLAAPPTGTWWIPATVGRAVLLPAEHGQNPADPDDPVPVDGIAAPVPMGDAMGVLLVADSLPDQPTFTDQHTKLFQALANHASVAMSKAMLVDRLRQEVTEKEHLAQHDPLTGLPNRTHFNELVEAAVAGDRPAAVVLMDLDRFKEVNDALGHDIGDTLLREVGSRLQERLNGRGVVARLGGDEFAVLLPGADSEEAAVALTAELTGALEQPIPVGQLRLNTRTSAGIALSPAHGTDARTLLRRADVAMYSAKDTHSGDRVYQPEQDRNTPRRLALIGELNQAIDRRDLQVVFQPKVDPTTGLVTGAEALARWEHPEQGFIPPDQFIPLAEHSGLIRPLTLHVLDVALRRCASWRRTGHDLDVAVNLSPNSLLDVGLPDVVAELLHQTGVPPSALTLEITESSIMADPTRSIRTLDRLHTLGVKLAIDDFGTGYSSLGRLRELPIHEVKIDKSFVQRMSVDHRDRAVVSSAVQLGHALELDVVAEGVEDVETYTDLSRQGCNVIQGYYVSRPLPPDTFTDWLAARTEPATVGRLILPGH
jgi:diguanylate cyclase (GGDEF)-like protein